MIMSDKNAVSTDISSDGFELIEQTVSLNRYTRSGKSKPFIVLPGIFKPDEWTALTIQAAMACLDTVRETRRIYDIGSGSGIIPLILTDWYPDRGLEFTCCDLKAEAGRNLSLNYQLFSERKVEPGFRCLDIREGGMAGHEDCPPDLIAANVPQLPAGNSGVGGTGWDPDDYHAMGPADSDDPVRAFGLGLLVDVIAAARAGQPGRLHIAFCRSSRIPLEVFDTFLEQIRGTVIHSGEEQMVRDGSTPYARLAEAEERFGLEGKYVWNGRTVSAQALRSTSPDRTVVRIGLRSCLVEVN